jgi:tripartite-type tricarboxylate transporter receptor subunit TctC
VLTGCRLDDALAFALNDPKIAERYATLGMNIPAETPEQFVKGLRKEAEFWSDAAKKANIKIE